MVTVNFLLTALLLGVVSMIIVFVSGLTSGVVGIFTLILRSVFAFAMTSAAIYFLLMVFDYFNETPKNEVEEFATEEIATEETPAENVETPPTQGFQPMNADNLPKA